MRKRDWGLGTGDWGLGTGDWGLGTGEVFSNVFALRANSITDFDCKKYPTVHSQRSTVISQ
ncbi:hypothetical protein JYQ62_21295 [Nostoc sp. UHCC 0702]|nr:hypothetical protein JYQ62_21295 [Nostoc sp. UHCC 0702]